MRIFRSIIGLALAALFVVGCSKSGSNSDEVVAGIEIGNPALALTADFSVDYNEVLEGVLAKSAAADEPVLLDSFAMDLFEVRSYSSYYVSVGFDAADGLPVWPYENSSDTLLPISFIEESAVIEPFSNINLMDEGYLKEIGVGLKPRNSNASIYGRLLVNGEYVPFEYSMTNFQKATLRYHFTQVEWVTDSLINLSVVFYVRYFVKGVDLTSAEISDDGIIHLNGEENSALWNKLNQRFLPSFRPLRYNVVDAQGNEIEDYVKDMWEDVVGAMSENTIKNGNFANGLEGWIFFTQMMGAASANVETEKDGDHILVVDVTNGGNKSYSVQLIQEDVALVAGKKYKCVFTIWSNVKGQITARIGTYDDYETIGFQEHVQVGTSGQSFEKEFSPAESTPFARFELNLGNEIRKFYIKDVKIYRLED